MAFQFTLYNLTLDDIIKDQIKGIDILAGCFS